MADEQVNPPAVKGLPPGAVVGSFSKPQPKPKHTDAPKIKGLPAGAVVGSFDKPAEKPKTEAPTASISAYNPTWWERVKNTVGYSGASGAVSEAKQAAQVTGDYTAAFRNFVNHPLVAVEELFPVNPKTKLGQLSKGASRAVSGMTSPTQVAMMAAPGAAVVKGGEYVASAMHAVGLAMMPTMGEGIVDTAHQIHEARQRGDDAGENEAWGEMAANVAMIVVPHVGGKIAEGGENTARLNDKAKDLYKKPFKQLTDPEKAHTLYSSVEDQSPGFRKRVDQETDKIRKSQTRGDAQADIEWMNDRAKANSARLQAAKTVLGQELQRQRAAEQYKQAQAAAEAKVKANEEAQRRTQYQAAKADEITPAAEERGFGVNDQRRNTRGDRGLVKTTEKETEPVHAPSPEPMEGGVKVVDKRTAPGSVEIQTASELERPVQEYAEENAGASFSSLPLDRQREVASKFEREQPEKWDAFKATPAYDAYRRHADMVEASRPAVTRWMNRNEGTGEPLAPGADETAGLARVILEHSNIAASMKAAPDIYRALSEYSEKNFGKSFDAIEKSDQVSALAGFLNEDPARAKAFTTPEIADRLSRGEHIDVANYEASLRDRQQVDTLMAYRDSTRAQVDQELAGQAVREARADHVQQIRNTITNATSAETGAGEALTNQAKGLTRLAERINLQDVGGSRDIFDVQRAIRKIPESQRSPDMNEFMSQMRQTRAAAERQVLDAYREDLISRMRTDIESGTERAAREVVHFEDQKQVINRAADRLGGPEALPEQKAEAEALRDTADFIQRKEDEIVAATEVVKPRTERETNPKMPAILGRETRVRLNSGEEVPVHYAVVDSNNLITSHRSTENYTPDPRYPQEAQPRNYQDQPELQAAVEERAGALDADQILSNSVLPVDGPPIVMPDGTVLSGNGRTQSMKLAQKRGRYEEVRASILDRAQAFGIDPASIFEMRNPVLVRVMDRTVTDPATLARYGIEMNRDPSQGMSSTEQSAALSRLLTPSVVERMANVFRSVSGDSSLRTAMRARSADLADILRDAGLVDPKKRSAYFTEDGDLTEPAKALIENTLAGIAVSNPQVLGRTSAAIKDKLGRVGMDFVIMRSAGEIWNLASYNTDAVELMTRAQDQSARLNQLEGRDVTKDESHGSESLIERLLHPERYRLSNFDLSFDGQATHPPVHPAVESLARALEETPREYANMIGDYAEEAERGGVTMFGAIHPADVFTEQIASKYGMEVIPEEWGMVGGLPDAAKEIIEEARNGLPVEPARAAEAVEEAIQPDSSSVIENEKGFEPTSVRDFRKALADHPGFTDEQAEAVGDIFERVLPRAIGESFDTILKNKMIRFRFGGEDRGARGATDIMEDGSKLIHLFDKADTSTVIHEAAHAIRHYLNGSDQAILNQFVEARPGAEWTTAQEEKFAEAFERYHYDGGRRRGALEKAFDTIHKAIQAVYDAVRGRGLAKASPEVEKMFDNWYDWTRSERKPITARVDVDALEKSVKDPKVAIPEGARILDETAHIDPNARNFVFTDRKSADDFIDRNNQAIRTYQLFDGKDGNFYVKASTVGKRLYQGGAASIGDLARQARQLEERLRTTTDPREEAKIRAQLASVENRLGGSTLIFGSTPERANSEVINAVHGVAEMPHMEEPTTPAQAMSARQVYGTTEFGGRDGERANVREVPDGNAGLPDATRTAEVPERTGAADGRDETTGRVLPGHPEPSGRGEETADGKRAASLPLAKMPAASLAAPKRARGTPLASPEAWRDYAEALGLPEGTPAPTVRLPDDLRNLMIFPGQPEAIEVALSGLQQYDGVVVASPTGSGKTFQALAIADQLLGDSGEKVGLIVTRSRNLIHDSDGYVDVGKQLGVSVEGLPASMNDVQGGGTYATTYAQIRGDKDMLSIPWDFVIFDESAELRKWMESEQGQSGRLLGRAAKKAVYMSATPFHTAVEIGYMDKLGLWPEGGFFEWARQFGVVETGPNSYTGGYAPKKLLKLRQQLIERGQWASLHRDLDGVTAHVGLVEQTPEVQDGVKKIRDVFNLAGKIFREQGKSSMARATQAQEVIYLKRYIESARLPHAIEMAKKAIADGWNPVIYSEYRSGTSEGMKFFERLPAGMADHLNKMLPALPDVVEAMRDGLKQDIGIFAGSANELRAEERQAFMDGTKKGVYTTYAAGGVGASFHDRAGDRPRMDIHLGLPWSGIMFEQSTGRTWRYGTKSNVAKIFLTSDALPEIKVLTTKILPRMRALNAVVRGEVVESRLAKSLRESVGISEEAIDYEMGNESAPEAAQFEERGAGVGFTRIEDLKLPRAKDAIGKDKGMKYKAQPKRLYQGPVDDPIDKSTSEAMKRNLEDVPPSMRRAYLANTPAISADVAIEGAKAAVAREPVVPAVERAAKDSKIGFDLAIGERGLFFQHTAGKQLAALKDFAREWMYLRHTSGDQAIRKIMAHEGFPSEGREVQRRLIERSHLKTDHQGELLAKVSDIIGDIRPSDHPLVVKVLEGKAESTDPAILKAVDGYRTFFSYVRNRLGDAGAKMKFYRDGKEQTVTYKQIADDPNYWPHIYDWNKPILIEGKNGAKPTVTTLGEIHDMPTNDARRQDLIEAYAGKRGISVVDAAKFFEKNRRGVRLSGNLEKGRRTSIPDYDTTNRAMNVYVDQVASMLANIETVGQEREKLNPLILQLPLATQQVVDSVVSADLNPSSVGESNKRLLRAASQWVVLSKMGLSTLKLPYHMAKTGLVTNLRSLAGGVFSTATSPIEATRMARDAGILTDYVRQAMMMEYGLHAGGLDQKMLTLTGFTPAIWISRIVSSAAGRVFLERYAAPALKANPKDVQLRRKLQDLYAYSDEDMDRIAASGYNTSDVRRAMIAAADWTTGSGRPSELPPSVRYAADHPISKQQNTLMRLTWMLKTYTFKTANLVNRTVFEGMKNPDWTEKDYKALGRWLIGFGAAGMGLRVMQYGINKKKNPEAAAEELRRFEGIQEHPQDALWLELGNVSYGMGIYPAKVMFDRLATHEPKDIKSFDTKKRLEFATAEESGGILASDLDHIRLAGINYYKTFGDDGVHHKASTEERRSKILADLAKQEIAPVGTVEAFFRPAKPEESKSEHIRHRRPARRRTHAIQ